MSLAPTHDAASAVVGQCDAGPGREGGRDAEPGAPQSDSATTPGGLQEYKRRELNTGVIEFEFAPAGYLNPYGEVRLKDWRAYFWTPAGGCVECGGSGRVPSEKRPGNTVKCQPCKGSGSAKRERMISVTTLLDAILPKGGLPIWAEARGIEGAIMAMRLGEIHKATEPSDGVEIVRSLKLGADRARDTAADRGINVHALLEVYMRTGDAPSLADHPVEHHGYIQGLCSWLLSRDPEPESVEDLVCSPGDRYAGRRDLVARCSGVRIGWDAKTQERAGIYASAHLQVKMYDRAAVASGDEPCDELRVVVFAANGEWREMPCEATTKTVERALAFYEVLKPIDSLCESWNRREREARR